MLECVPAVFENTIVGECLMSVSTGLMEVLNSVTSQLKNLNHHPVLLLFLSSVCPQVYLNCRILTFPTTQTFELISSGKKAEED